MAAVQIIVGSVMGTALEVAQNMEQALIALDHQVQINPQFRKDHLSDPLEVLLICTSNTGMGDLPMNIIPFYQHLTNDYPRLVGRRYGVVNLGDSSYPNFAQAGKTLDDALADLGAERIGEPLVLDAIYDNDPVTTARDWVQRWSALL